MHEYLRHLVAQVGDPQVIGLRTAHGADGTDCSVLCVCRRQHTIGLQPMEVLHDVVTGENQILSLDLLFAPQCIAQGETIQPGANHNAADQYRHD